MLFAVFMHLIVKMEKKRFNSFFYRTKTPYLCNTLCVELGMHFLI
jgi:hypothetical protein